MEEVHTLCVGAGSVCAWGPGAMCVSRAQRGIPFFRYFTQRVAYWLNNVDGAVDNADQRLTQDIEAVRGAVCVTV